MFTKINVNHQFYLKNHFYLNSESDSDEDFLIMSNTTNQSTAASKIHKELGKFFEKNPIPDETYTENINVIKALFSAEEHLWNQYREAVAQYSNDDTDEMRLQKAIAIGKAATALRNSNDDLKATVIHENQPEVTISGLSVEEVTNLKELEKLLRTKMSGQGKKGNAEQANEMLKEFLNDMEKAKLTGSLSDKWTQHNRIWKCCQHYKQKNDGLELTYAKTNDDLWNKVVDDFNKRKLEPAPTAGNTLSGAANKFSVDVYCATISQFKHKLPSLNIDDFLHGMRIVSAFLQCSSIKRGHWSKIVVIQEKYRPFFGSIDEVSDLYDNPGKITRPRLFACAASLYKASEPLALFGVQNRLASIPKMIALIYRIEKEKGCISNEQRTSSTSEHLLHVLLTLGSKHQYVHNRNNIKGSVREVKFHLN